MAAVIDALSLKPGGLLTVGERGSDKVTETATFTCAHCGRMVAMHPQRQRPRHTCKRCMKLVCDYCPRECLPIEADAERAYRDLGGQPWLLRSYGEPIDRIWLPDGTERLVLRRDHNLSLAERQRFRRGGEG